MKNNMKDKIIMVKFGRKIYPTHIVNGTQRFIAKKRMSKSELLELRWSLGYFVEGLTGCYPGYKIENPLWK